MSAPASIHIVLIEDNEADVDLIVEALRLHRIEHELVHYDSGDEALGNLCPEPDALLEPPDLILLDLHLPGIEGPEILRALRGEPRLGSVPIVILTGADVQRLGHVDLSGSVRVVQKSMELDTYLDNVSNAVLELFPRLDPLEPRPNGGAPARRRAPADARPARRGAKRADHPLRKRRTS